MAWNLILILTGLLFLFLLFYRFPVLPAGKNAEIETKTITITKTKTKPPVAVRISVIIPARNEEKNLPLLLSDLQKQTVQPWEIICVDDGSTDQTAQIAASFGIRVISIQDKPAGWIGKSWACKIGAEAADGDWFLFLDSDVRLEPDAVSKLADATGNSGFVISVQPFHIMEKWYEQLSFFFNLIEVAANGAGIPRIHLNAGLYGPVILISRPDYAAINGHFPTRNSIVDDITMGKCLQKAGISYRLFLGDGDISFRMYGGGIRDLLQGWTKNIADGAYKTPFLLFFMVFVSVAACISVAIQLILALAWFDLQNILIYSVLYLGWVAGLRRASRKLGNFKRRTVLIYPLCLLFFLIVFFLSVFKRLFRMNVRWKGRNIRPG